jgi:hypothetical protein
MLVFVFILVLVVLVIMLVIHANLDVLGVNAGLGLDSGVGPDRSWDGCILNV